MKIAFVGGGNMGEAMLSAILGKGLSASRAVSVSDINEARRQYLEQEYGIEVLSDNRLAAAGGDVVVLAIKPQDLIEVMAELNGQLEPSQLVLSIIAGARIDTLRHGLNHGCVVRAMPNTPAQIGEGITVWTATAEVSQPQKAQAASILATMGREIYVADEAYIDMATAVSGSGPAYFFLMIESLVAAGTHIGLPQDIAQELVIIHGSEW